MEHTINFGDTPQAICFANEPIPVSVLVTHDLTGYRFPRVVLKATFTLDASGYNTGSTTFTTSLSNAVAGTNSVVHFNLSDAAQTLFRQKLLSLHPDQTNTFYRIHQTFQLECSLMALSDTQEVCLDQITWPLADAADRTLPRALPGGRSEYLRMVHGDTMPAALSPLSLKPDGETLYVGQKCIQPLYSPTAVNSVAFKITSGSQDYSPSTFDLKALSAGYAITTVAVDVPVDQPAALVCGAEALRQVTVRAARPDVHHLCFINTFGMIETISVQSLESLQYEIGSESFDTSVQPGQSQPTAHRYLRKSQPAASYSLSSGYVSREWASWYVSQLLTTPRAWMLVEGHWLPGVIEADDKTQLYDRAKPELPHVDFSFKLAIDGVVE